MNERLQRTGMYKKFDLGNGVERILEAYDILSVDMRTTIDTVWGVDAASRKLQEFVLQERLACPTGGCED